MAFQTVSATREAIRVAGIGEMVVTNDISQILVTYSLGSCIGVSVFDPEANVGGLIHCMLPNSKIEPEKAARRPCMFVDTGVVALLQAMMDMGAQGRRMKIKVAGAGSPMDHVGRFKIGERNMATFRKVLWKNNLMIAAEDIGGTEPRTMSLYMGQGRTTIRNSGTEVDL